MQYLLPFSRLSYLFVNGLFCWAEAFQFDIVPVYFPFFGFPCQGIHIGKDVKLISKSI